MSTSYHILIIDDDRGVADVLREALVLDGYQVTMAEDGRKGVEVARLIKPALILLDWMMPEMNGLEVCRTLRKTPETSDTPILMLTGRDTEEDIVAGLNEGADDYLAKPFRPRELSARVRALLRRNSENESSADAVDPADAEHCPIRIDVARHEVFVGDNVVQLTQAEFRLLHHLREHPGIVYQRRELLAVINAGPTSVEANVDVHVSALRKKLGKDGRWVVTVRGVGYKLRAA